MKYDFTSIIDRHGKDAHAVDGIGRKRWGSEPDGPREGFDVIPMWVADMNFATCPTITESITNRLKHPLFGYYSERDEYFDAIINWQTRRNGMKDLQREYIGYENGVHGFVSSAVKALSIPGEKILVHSPFYTGFSMDIEGTGRTTVFSPLIKDKDGIWRMDYEDMDAKLKANNIHLAILCSPHNPSGRVWERWELERAMEVYERNECFVISDEIWADIVFTGHEHIPTLMVNDWAREHTAAAYAPSKTFNLAGFVGSYHIIYNKYLRDRVRAEAVSTHYNSMNVLSMYALIGAYSEEGHVWVNELRQVLEENSKYAYDYINEHFDGVEVSMPQGTYMLFLDCTSYCERTGKSIDDVIKAGWDVGVAWQDGRGFKGPCHIRMNVASPMSRIREAFDRLDKYVFNS